MNTEQRTFKKVVKARRRHERRIRNWKNEQVMKTATLAKMREEQKKAGRARAQKALLKRKGQVTNADTPESVSNETASHAGV